MKTTAEKAKLLVSDLAARGEDITNFMPGSEERTLLGADGNPVSSEPPKPIAFEERHYEFFDVEVTRRADDVIYHFWPVNNGEKFCANFAKHLEYGFKTTLPYDADVRAEFTSREESAVLGHVDGVHMDKESRSTTDVKWVPRETYFIRVLNGANYPLWEIFLKDRILNTITAAAKAAQAG